MGKPSRVANAGTYFVTSQTWERRRVFQVESNARLFLQKLESYRSHYWLHAYVVMPDHIHLLITPEDITLERVMQFIKGGYSHALRVKSPVWQRGFTDHRVRDSQDVQNHIRYIEENPLGAHLSEITSDYPFSSAHPNRLRLDVLSLNLSMPPQGLKPRSLISRYGTAEAVPLRVNDRGEL